MQDSKNLLNPTMSRISLILHEAEAKPRSVNIKDILRMQVKFSCLLSHKGIMLLMLSMAYKGFNRLLLMYINTLWLDAYVNTVKPLKCMAWVICVIC